MLGHIGAAARAWYREAARAEGWLCFDPGVFIPGPSEDVVSSGEVVKTDIENLEDLLARGPEPV